ncbi:DUF4123 domain-containing protein [Rugamonas aquatica]|uniref:DUF4123 domain-containing protein n=1 Tax=Rugamonas aquatica TaxID=2743357 RepID=A0A6A7MUZ3_9BURK|nr:DUF4123 domain-containing protein [Rugamonas aquatica]MQA36783.1 DUF4123 domain-containing protein [Rugamonas aquatica]
MYFALEPCNPTAIRSELMRRIERSPDWNWMALVDGAFDFGGKKRLVYSDSIKLFDCEMLQEIVEASPYIIRLSSNNLELIHSEIISLSKHRHDRPMLSFFSSKYSAVEIAERWRKFLNASSPDGLELILRFSDTRVLEYLPNCLQLNNWSGITNLIEEWMYINRNGEIEDVNVSKDVHVGSEKFLLSEFEFNALVESSEPDCLISILHRDYPEVVPNVGRNIFYNKVEELYKFSKINGIENFHDIVSMVLFGLISAIEVEKNDDVAKLLNEGKWVPGSLIDSLDEILK